VAVYEAYGTRRTDTVTPPGYDRALPYVRALELQARRLAEALTGDTDFTAFRL
jgi:CRISPR/Cas system-associated endonuclease Cas1